jgi:hypothetical protein
MVHLMGSKDLHRWSKEVGIALLILIFSIALSVFLGRFSFWEAISRGFLRFLRLALLLCVSLWMLLPVCSKLGLIFRRKRGAFIQLKEKQELEIHPLKHWLFRPFQGIGIGLLFATKLLGVLQIASGSTATASLFFHRSQFQLGRLLAITGITVFVSLIISTLWTLDDLGIRYFNRKDYEIKMVGKYVGTLMPILFGFYGILSFFGEFSKAQALFYLLQIILILYPPFTIFSVFHAHFVRKRAEDLSDRLHAEKGGLLH